MIGRNPSTKLVAVMLGVALVATACGDDDGGSAGGGSIEEWCNSLALSDEGDAIFQSLATDDPATIESNMGRIAGIVDDLAAAAPPEIAEDVDYLADYTRQLQGALSDANYSLFDTDLSGLDEQRLDEMQSNLDAFTTRECGRPFGGGDDDVADSGDEGDDDSSFDPAGGTIREQLVQQFLAIGLTQQEAECIADNVDPTDESVLTGDEAAILALFEACDISLSRLAELGG